MRQTVRRVMDVMIEEKRPQFTNDVDFVERWVTNNSHARAFPFFAITHDEQGELDKVWGLRSLAPTSDAVPLERVYGTSCQGCFNGGWNECLCGEEDTE